MFLPISTKTLFKKIVFWLFFVFLGVKAQAQCSAAFTVTGSKCLGDSVFFQFTGKGDTLIWDFADPSSGFYNTSSDSNVVHVFTAKGVFNTRLIVKDTNGCSDTVWHTWSVYNKPIANFNFANACLGLNALFTSNSSSDLNNPISSYYYKFGDGDTSTFSSPSHAYTSTGAKTVKLLVQTTQGCKDSIQKSLIVYAPPSVLLSTDSICPGDNLNIDIQHGTDPVTQYYWTLGDGSISNSKTFTQQYNSSGLKHITVKLTYSNGNTCLFNKDSVLVYNRPNAFFTLLTPKNQCYKGNQTCVQFGTDTTQITYRNMLWDDGSSVLLNKNSTGACYTYNNDNGGVYKITHEVIDTNGCAARYTALVDSVTIYKDPKANFKVTVQGGCFKTKATVVNLSNMQPPIIKRFTWNWGDGSVIDTSTFTNLTHDFIVNGVFKIKLSITDQYGCKDSFLSSDTVKNINFKVDGITYAIDSCQSSNVFKFIQTPVTGALATWFFGDGDTLDGWNVNHQYHRGSRIGTYYPKIRVSKLGCDSIINLKPNIVYGPWVDMSILNRYQCQVKDTVYFNNTSLLYLNKKISVFWDAQDPFAANCLINTQQNQNVDSNCNLSVDSLSFKHMYKKGRDNCYSVKLTLVDSALGCKDTKVYGLPLMKPDAHTGINMSSYGGFCLGPEGAKTVWIDLGPTKPSCGRERYWVMWDSLCAEESGNFNAWWQMNTSSHNYTYVPCDSNGNISIGVIIQNGTDTNGRVCRDTAFYHHKVRFGLTDPRFTTTYDPTVQYCKNSSFDFMLVDSTLDSIVYINWDYGDGVSESNLSLGKRTHKYTKRGRYRVVVTMRHANGCVAVDSMVIRIGAQPSLVFNKQKICLNDSVKVVNTTRYWNGPAYWKDSLRFLNNKETTRWDIGDGNGFSTGQYSTYFKFNKIGNYNIKLEYTDSVGCVDTFSYAFPIRVFDVFSAMTLPGKQLVCAQVIQFKSSASVYDSLNQFGHTDDSVVTHTWYFDQASSAGLLKNPFKFFKRGWHDVELQVTNTLGCKDTKKDSFFINGPEAGFEMVSDTVGCMPLTVTFKNNSLNANSYTWLYKNPGNNTTITNSYANIAFTYANYGIFRPQLIARNTFLNNGITVTCADTFVVNPLVKYSPKIEVYELPRPNFTHSTNCANYTTTFTNTSALTTGNIVQYVWSFGDGSSSNLANPVHQYADSGKYTIVLRAYSPYGCVDSVIRDIFVYPFPEADFTFNEVCQGRATNFRDISKSFNDIITNYTWNFGNGAGSSTKNPNYVYPKDSVYYLVRLTVRNRSGCIDDVTKQVRVWAKPKPNFTAVNVCHLSSMSFSNTGSSKQAVQSNVWTMGDGSVLQSNGFVKVYADTGKYTVKLKTTTIQGCTDSVSKQVQIFANPTADFNINSSSQCLNQNRFVLSNASTMYSGTITAYEWRLSDGYVSTKANVVHSFPSVNTYSIKLITRSNNFCYDTITKFVNVRPSPKSILQISAIEKCINTADSIAFNDVSTIDTSIASRIWTLDPGITKTLKQFKYKYTTVGAHPISLRVQNSVACWDTSYGLVTIHPKPEALIAKHVTEQCFRSNLFAYKDSSKILSPYTLSTIWQFGDGDTSTLPITSHQYNTFDTFRLTLIAFSNKGCKDTAKQILVVHPMPKSVFVIDTLKQCLKANKFNFTNQSSIHHGSMSYNWLFGDASNSSLKDPSHSYAAFGVYACSLIVQSNFGCKDTSSKALQVFSMPVANFKWLDSTSCFRANNMTAINTSSIPQGVYTTYWTSMVKQLMGKDTFNVQWPKDSSYTVQLKLVSNAGCLDSVRKKAYVWPMPVAAFNIDSAKQCLRSNWFKFSNASFAKDGNLSYQWSFGNGYNAIQKDTQMRYLNQGTYSVRLIVNSVRNCKDTVRHTVVVHPMPKALFSINDSTQCFNTQNFVFTDESKIAYGSLKRLWTWSDNTNDTGNVASHYFVKDTVFKNRLIAISDQNCADTAMLFVETYSVPKPNFSINDTDQCLPVQRFIMSNLSKIKQGSMTYQWLFGDGNTSNTFNAQHVYGLPGVYAIQLKAISNFGCRDSISKTNVVYHQPKAKLLVNDSDQCLRFNQFALTGNSTIQQGSIVAYYWDTSGLNATGLKDRTISFGSHGSKLLRYIVKSDKACFDTMYQTLTVHPMPKAKFNINDSVQCAQNNTFIFTAKSSIAYGTLKHKWWLAQTFRDSGIVIAKSFNAADTPIIQLVTVSDKLCTDTLDRLVFVQPSPKSYFTVNQLGQCLKINQFDALNRATVPHGFMRFVWRISDGFVSTDTSISHKFAKHGDFKIRLWVSSNYDCVDSFEQGVLVHPEPIANFKVNDAGQCVKGNQFVFSNLSTIDSTQMGYDWSFGDGDTSRVKAPIHNYLFYGDYKVMLTARSIYNCQDSFKATMYVNPMPRARFSLNDTDQCVNAQSFDFTNASWIQKGSLKTHQWQLNGQVFNTWNVVNYRFNQIGLLPVKLIETSDSLCRDTAQSVVTIYAKPKADFSINDTSQCLVGNRFIMRSTATDWNGIRKHQWWVDTQFNTIDSVLIKSFTTVGWHSIQYVTTSNTLCSDTILKLVRVKPMPNPQFNTLKPFYCNNEPPVLLTPVVPGGVFSGINVVGNYLYPKQLFADTVKYTVTVNQCTSSSQQATMIYPMPVVKLGNDTLLCQTESILLKAKNWNSTYYWQDGNVNETYRVSQAGKYWVTATNICGSVSDTIQVNYRDHNCRLWIPTAFTPNGDPLNEFYKPIGNDLLSMDYKIFNRWGELIYVGDLNAPGWSGDYMGLPAQDAYFVVLVNYSYMNSGQMFIFSEREVFYLLR